MAINFRSGKLTYTFGFDSNVISYGNKPPYASHPLADTFDSGVISYGNKTLIFCGCLMDQFDSSIISYF